MSMRVRNLPHPGGVIFDVMEEMNMSVAAVARALGISRYRLNRVMHGEIPISPELALRFEAVIGSTAGCWLRVQAAYDEDRIRREGAAIVRGLKRLEPPPDPFEAEIKTPVKRKAKKRNGRTAGKPRETARPAKRTARPAKKASGKSAAKMRKAA